MPPDDIASEMHRHAVAHARLAARASYLGWRHLRSEYSQDIDTVLATLETDGPWTWTLPVGAMASSDGHGGDRGDAPAGGGEVLGYVAATNMAEIRQQYESMRTLVELWDWISMTDLRSSWYVLTHGVGTLTEKPAGNEFQIESVTMFPIGRDGILGEVQIGAIANERPNRWPEVPSGSQPVPLPLKRLQATILHNELMDAIRAEDVERILATMRPNVATAMRGYLSDGYEVLNAEGSAALGNYYRDLFARFEVKDLRLVNRVVESWFVFAELHWVVARRSGPSAGEVLEFCTADIAPIDAEGRFWVRTGIGSDPVATAGGDFEPLASYLDERGPAERQGWEFRLLSGS